MRAKKKRIILFVAVLLILAAAAAAVLQFTQFGYLTTDSCRSAFTEIASRVYINRDYAGKAPVLYVFGTCLAVFVCGAVIDLIRQLLEKHTLTVLFGSKFYLNIKNKIKCVYDKFLEKI